MTQPDPNRVIARLQHQLAEALALQARYAALADQLADQLVDEQQQTQQDRDDTSTTDG